MYKRKTTKKETSNSPSSSFEHESIEKRNQLNICKCALPVHQLHAGLKSGVAQSMFGLEINVERPASCVGVIGSKRRVLAERAPIPCNLFHPAQHLHHSFFLKFSFNDFLEDSIVFS